MLKDDAEFDQNQPVKCLELTLDMPQRKLLDIVKVKGEIAQLKCFKDMIQFDTVAESGAESGFDGD